MTRARATHVLILSLAVMLASRIVGAQGTGTIAGVVRDTTGAVLPGVSIEAASPALIEKVRTAVTDSQGNYKIVNLRPGIYTLTFLLQGFGTVRRDSLQVTTGFTATVNADMRVGDLQETVTVTGASPVVDIQNVRSQVALSREVWDALPIAKTLQSYATLTLGAAYATASSQDVGGNQGEAGGFGYWTVHGNRSNDQRMTFDGMPFYQLIGEGAAGNRSQFINQLMVQETTIQTSGMSAEIETGGVQINIVPKDGGNAFSGTVALNGTGSGVQSSNLDDALRARGIPTPPKVKKIYDGGGALGGLIVKDRLWFFTAHRWWGTQNTAPGNYFATTLHSLTYTPDLSRPAFTDFPHRSNDVRLTWQVSAKNKVTFTQNSQNQINGYYEVDRGTRTPEATADLLHPVYLTQGTWSYPRTNKLLFEAGDSTLLATQNNVRNSGVLPTDVSITELSTGVMYNARATAVGSIDYGVGYKRHTSNQRFAVSYVTGSHAFKTGLFLQEGWGKDSPALNAVPLLGPVSFQFLRGVPSQLTEFSSPNHYRWRLMPGLGLYAQDQWTIAKLTLNLGIRYDRVREYDPAESVDAIPALGIPARTFAEVDEVPLWNDISPRFGAAYDVFGNGKTAVKVSFGRYVASQVSGLGVANAPANRIALSATRTWADINTNFVPDCDLTNPLANGECGRLSNLNLGLPIPATVFDPNFLTGSGKRPYSWQDAVSIQQELRPNVALTAGYFNTWYGNFTVVANQAVASSDFNSYCVTAPTDARLGSNSGQQICGLYDVTPAKFGQVSNFATFASNFGKQYEHYNGIDVGLSARFGKGGVLQSGWSTGQTVTDNCAVVQNNPQVTFTVAGGAGGSASATGARADRTFCHVVLPWKAQSQFKIAGNYRLPWYGVQVSGTYQNLPGFPIEAFGVFTNAQIVPSLGRNLAAGATGTVSVPLMVPNEVYEGRINQLDLRLMKNLKVAHYRLQGQFDIYNAFNANPILGESFTYGSSWLKPSAVLGGRLLKFGMQLDF